MDKIYVFNGLTGEDNVRDLTAAEKIEIDDQRAAYAKEKAEKEKESAIFENAKNALLAKLGITADEAKLLLAPTLSTPIVSGDAD